MNAEDISYHRRVRGLDYAAQVGVTAACRAVGISRTTYYRSENRARRYGLSALLPKARRKPAMPNAMTPEEVSAILAEAVANPTLGARQLAGRLLLEASIGRRQVSTRSWFVATSGPAANGSRAGLDHRG